MKFNVTNLDKVLLLQTLYVHADPKGYGVGRYNDLQQQGKIVEGLSRKECEVILNRRQGEGTGYLVDYYNGKPIKLYIEDMPADQLWINSIPYDLAHGRFRFLEALLNTFDPEEIIITKKEYDPFHYQWHFKRENARINEYELAQLLDHASSFTDKTGTFWKIDSADTPYRSAFLNGLDI